MRALALTLGLSLLIAAGAAAQQGRDLSGMSSAEIKALQQRLADGGCYHGSIDGQASPALEEAIKACPSQDPILRIETGMHVAVIHRIGVDRACRIAATGSDDKTVRVWSLPEGRLLRTLRVPIGPGNGGKIYATAVSPDGRWIAAGGWDAQWDVTRYHYVYIFEALTGALVAHIGPFGSVINHLTFSPDGRWLAATSAAEVGLKVIDTQTWQIVATDEAYAGASYGAAFAPDGRLYTVAFDHKLRQYGPGPAFKKERENSTQGDLLPISVAVDPRDQLVAVGMDHTPRIDLYDAATLRYRFTADTTRIDNGDLGLVTWSSDGAHLVAGGHYHAQFQGRSQYLLLTFGRDGQRVGQPLPLADDTILDLQPCGSAIAVAASDPAFGLVDGNGHVALWKTGVAPDMRRKRGDALTVAPDAKKVRFGLALGGEEPACSILRKRLDERVDSPARLPRASH